MENLARNLMTGTQTDLILLDFSKAFDKVSHLKLLYKPKMHGIDGNTRKWIQSFLIGRTQTVVLEGKTSEELSVTSCRKISNHKFVYLLMILQYT